MKTKSTLLVVLIILSTSFAQNKELTLEDIFLSDKFEPEKLENLRWKKDGSAFAFTKINSVTSLRDIYVFNILSLEEELFLSSDRMTFNEAQIEMSSFEWTDNAEYLIIREQEKAIWRHSKKSPAYIFNTESGDLYPIADGYPGLKNIKFSPVGDYVGYVKQHNIYITELSTGKETQLTFDGSGNILNGEFDWVYEEEFSIADGWLWSPDGSKISFWKFDQTRVKEFYLIDEMGVYNEVIPLKYPKAGEQNAIVRIGIIDLSTMQTTWICTGENDDIYIPRIYWIDQNSKLAVMKLNRFQNELLLLLADAENGNVRTILSERDSCWVDVVDHNFIPINKENKFLWVSEKSGYRHIYLHDFSGKFNNQVTSGDWEVTSLRGFSVNDGCVYFYGKKDNILEQQIYRVKLDGSSFEKITEMPGWHEADFSPDYRCFVNSYNSVSVPLEIHLRKTDGEMISVLRKNNFPAFSMYGINSPEFESFTTRDGTILNYMITLPEDFDPKRKYPVLVYGYGGPGSQNVINRWRGKRQLWHQMMAEKGFVIFTLDNRGTGGRGKEFKNLSYKDLAKWVVNDHIEAVEHLATFPYIDKNRIGVWGWSGGGTLTLHLLTRARDYFKSGVSVAANTDFLLYDTIWSERYLGLPQDNTGVYLKSSAKSYIHLLQGNLLLVHGTKDDNVHYQHTMQIVKMLQDSGKQFEMMIYPEKNHSIRGNATQKHLYETITNFFLRTL